MTIDIGETQVDTAVITTDTERMLANKLIDNAIANITPVVTGMYVSAKRKTDVADDGTVGIMMSEDVEIVDGKMSIAESWEQSISYPHAIVAVTDDGMILISRDGGRHWCETTYYQPSDLMRSRASARNRLAERV